MLGVRINNTFLELFPDTKVSFELNNPALSTGNDVGLATMPIRFPDTDKNRKALEFVSLPDVYKKIYSFEAELYFQGVSVAIGKLILTEAGEGDGGYIEGFISINGIAADAFDKRLRDYDWPVFLIGNTPSAVTSHAESKLAPDWKNVYCFAPLKQINFYGDTNPHFYVSNVTPNSRGGIVNAWDFANQTFFKNTMPATGSYLPDSTVRYNKQALVPYVYLHYVLRFVFTQMGITLNGEFMDDAALSKLVFYNNYALDRKIDKNYLADVNQTAPQNVPASGLATFTTIVCDNVITDTEACYNTGTGEYKPGFAGNHIAAIDLTITYPVGQIGDSVRVQVFYGTHIIHQEDLNYTGSNPVNFSWAGGFYAQPSEVGVAPFLVEVAAMTVLPVTNVFVECTKFTVQATDAPQLNVFADKIVLRNHIPDISVSELLEIIRSYFTLSFDFDFTAKACTINLAKNTLGKYGVRRYNTKASTQALTRFSNPPHYRLKFPFDGENYNPEEAASKSGYNYVGQFASFSAIEAIPSPQVDDMALALDRNMLYVYTYDTNTNQNLWLTLGYNYYPMVTGSNPEEVSPAASPLLTDYWGNMLQYYFLPKTDEPGTSEVFKTGDNAFGLKLGFYTGLQPDSNGDFYPMITSLGRRTDGAVIGPYSLRWDEAGRGLYDAFLKEWHSFKLNTEEREQDFLLSLPEFSAFNFSKPCEIKGVWYVVGQLTAELSNSGLSIANALIYRIMP